MSLSLLSPDEEMGKGSFGASMVTPNKDILLDYQARKGAYYTAFPQPGVWEARYTDQDYRNALVEVLKADPGLPLQFYVHYPYCKYQCWFCQCYQLISRNETELRNFAAQMLKEIDLLIAWFKKHNLKPNFTEIHLGGGTPSYIPTDMFDQLIDKLHTFIDFKNIKEFAIEIDPRATVKEQILHFHEKGINRISFGIQDVNPAVQKAINRIQSIESVEKLLETRHLFKGVNFDLIYGLPLQTRKTLRDSLTEVFRLSPDRIAFSILGYRPDVFKHNAYMNKEDIPDTLERCHMWEDSLPYFLENGYERIGMDHFAKPNDEIAIAKKKGKLFRNQMGYSPGRFADVIAIGPSGMSRVGYYYFSNSYQLTDYTQSIDQGKFPIVRGYKLNRDLEIRRDIMNKIMVYYHINYNYFSELYGIDFKKYFAHELESLKEFVDIGALVMNDDSFTATYFGNYYFLRHFCMIFDNLGKEYKHNIETGKPLRSLSTADVK